MTIVTAEAIASPAAQPAGGRGTPLDPALLAALAHELRNPLAPLVNALFLLRGKVAGDVDASWALDIVDRQLGDLRALLDDASDIARILRGRLPRGSESLDVAAAAGAALEATQAALAGHRQTARVTAAHDGALIVLGDAGRIARAIAALLLYAARAAPQGEVIEVAVAAAGTSIEIVIGAIGSAAPDDGAGPFERVAMPTSDAGIGVAFAQIVAQWHEGSLEFAADPTGRPRFRLRLPLAAR